MTSAEPLTTPPARASGDDIVLRNVTRTYRTEAAVDISALQQVTLTIGGGERVAVMAPSGAGKSTLLHLIGAMDRPDDGCLLVGGEDITAMSRRQLVGYRRTVGFVFQRFHLIPVLSALDNVITPVMPYRTPYDKADRARELLTLVGLGDRTDSVPARLSGGQQQRVAIARALINRPRVLLADEPTGNLDSITGQDVMTLLLDIAHDLGATVVLATHNQAVADQCDRVIHLRDGRLV